MKRSVFLKKITAVILAAGKGTRMKSDKTKVLHEVAGKPMISYVIDACLKAGVLDIVIIAGANFPELKEFFGKAYPGMDIKFVIQKKQLGTAHAVSIALNSKIRFNKAVLILSGDVPMITPETIRSMIREFTKSSPGGIICTSTVVEPFGYGRIVNDDAGHIIRIVEEKDATAAEKKISEINSGIYIFEANSLKKYIKLIKLNPVKKEYYLTDIAGVMAENDVIIRPLTVNYAETVGINDRVQLMEANKVKNKKTLEKLAKNGITIADFDTVIIDDNVSIGRDTVINPFTVIHGKTRIGRGCIIGPFAHIRADVEIGDLCKIGNYVEIKKSVIGSHTNIAHLSYIGDAELGNNVNIGAGTITCNYDGVNKNKTMIGNNVFVGSDTKFVAPVKIGNDTTIAAGSVITEDVPAGALGIARARQVNKEKWKQNRRNK
jgi:bifunctional UDP-N-acetylglucosamine pyrophosphorylase/glucosamine-1-phosphate N-acetyltransferase